VQHTTTIILGSSSPFRRDLMQRLGLKFQVVAPSIDETPQDDETPLALVRRLSVEKAHAVAAVIGGASTTARPSAVIISSDQVAVIEGQVIGKPLGHERAVGQLEAASGKEVVYHTGLCVLATDSMEVQLDVIQVRVGFRKLSRKRIEAYLAKDQPYQCAGSIRAEQAGPALFRYVRTDDPTALIGLPLIRLTEMLETAGVDVLDGG
jgi:septum formation protein